MQPTLLAKRRVCTRLYYMRTRVHRRQKLLRARKDLKDRLIQTRVPESLESALKDEAKKRRLSVSHLIRNVLEDTFELVDGVVAEVGNIVQDSVGLAERVRSDASRIASHARSNASASVRPAKPAAKSLKSLDHILAWNKVVMNRDGECARCGRAMHKGSEAQLGVSQTPSDAPTWLCSRCLADL